MRTREQLELIDVWSYEVDEFTTEEEDIFLEICRERANRMTPNATPPCQCNHCDNWVDIDDLYHTIGSQHDKVICIECAEHIFIKEDMDDD